MLKAKTLTIGNIYVPTKRRRMLELTRVEKIAESILEARPDNTHSGP